MVSILLVVEVWRRAGATAVPFASCLVGDMTVVARGLLTLQGAGPSRRPGLGRRTGGLRLGLRFGQGLPCSLATTFGGLAKAKRGARALFHGITRGGCDTLPAGTARRRGRGFLTQLVGRARSRTLAGSGATGAERGAACGLGGAALGAV